MKAILLAFSLFVFPMAHAKKLDFDTFNNKDFDASIHFSSRGHAVESRTQEVYKLGQVISLAWQTHLSDKLTAVFDAGLVLEAGSNNSSFNANFRPLTTIYLSEIKLHWRPTSRLSMEAGALGMHVYDMPLLLSGSAFIGVRQDYTLAQSRSWRLSVDAIQSIPNNYTLAQRYGDVSDEGTPNFFMERVKLSVGSDQNIKWDSFVGHFLFANLSAPVAWNSRLGGNSVSVGTVNNAQFLYGFRGWVSGSSLDVKMAKTWNIHPYVRYLFNERAPNGRNEGYNGGVILTKYAKRYNWSPQVELYKNESDSSPAFYNNKFYGNNNNKGMMLGLSVEDKKQEFHYFVNYYNFRYLRDTSPGIWQADTQVVTIGVRTAYDIF